MKRICAITGSRGYVGSCIKSYFTAHGWDVLELTRQPAAGVRALPFQLGSDLAPSALQGVDALVHCAYDFRPLSKEEIHAVNVVGTEKLLQAARVAGVKNIVQISTISAYSGCRSFYGQAKLEIEARALAVGAQVIRPGLVYGSSPGGMFGRLTEQVKKSSRIPLISDGSQIQFLVHQDDLSALVMRCASGEVKFSPLVLTAADSRPWPFRELLLEIARALNKKISFVPLPWRLVWAGLKTAELCGLRLNFRSDSLVSLMYQNPAPDFSLNAAQGFVCRPFSVQEIKL